MTEEKILQALPTVAGIAAKLTLAVLKKQNVALAPLLRRAGLLEHDFDGRPHRISAASQGKFLEYAAEAMDDSAFGLHLAESANPREAGLLFYITSAASNIDEALALFARYSRIVNEAVRIKPAHAREGLIAEIRRNLHRPRVEWESIASAEPIDPQRVVSGVKAALDRAEEFVGRMPTEKMGLLFLKDGEVVQPDPDRLSEYETHEGRCGGHWPSDPGIQQTMLQRYAK